MEISNMSDSDKLIRIKEIKQLIANTKSERDYAKAMQLALKLVLNGTYGAFCHSAFTVSNADIANSITASSREVINWMLDLIENFFYNVWGKNADLSIIGTMYISKLDNKYFMHRNDGTTIDKWGRVDDEDGKGYDKLMEAYHLTVTDYTENDKTEFITDGKTYEVIQKIFIVDLSNVKPIPNDFDVEPRPDLTDNSSLHLFRGIRSTPLVIYGDTDSVDASSSIHYEKGILSIEDLYDKCKKNGSAGNTLKGHESVLCDEKVLNYSKEKNLYYAPVKRIIRHKVTKQKWKLKTKSGKEIIVTNDHSMIVFRDGIQIEVKPCDILLTDKILSIKEKK